MFGSLKNCSQKALDSRSSFFVNKEPYLLYLWEVLENHDLLVSSMQRLNSFAIAANGADGIPSEIGQVVSTISLPTPLLFLDFSLTLVN